jgi:hypothetical protein
MIIAYLIELMKREGGRLAKPIPVEEMPDMTFSCTFSTDGITPDELAKILPHCPQDLADFWANARTAQLFEDEVYGQWGLEILDPEQAIDATREFYDDRGRDFAKGDLVVGRFLGDSDRLIIRSDPSSDDFGSVFIALPIDPRTEWYRVADSFGNFLDSFVKSGGDKYWETASQSE